MFLSIEQYQRREKLAVRGIRRRKYAQTIIILLMPFFASTPCFSQLISNLQPPAYRTALIEKDYQYYIDRDYTANVPVFLIGTTAILTANDDKQNAGLQVTFDIDKATDVYVAYDPRFSKPSWLSPFMLLVGQIKVTGDPGVSLFDLYWREADSGSVELGANPTGNGSMYFAFVKTAIDTLAGSGIIVDWQENTEPDLSLYTIYFQSLPGVREKKDVFLPPDTLELPANNLYRFWMTASDTAGNESEVSNKVLFYFRSTSDHAPPLPPVVSVKGDTVSIRTNRPLNIIIKRQ